MLNGILILMKKYNKSRSTIYRKLQSGEISNEEYQEAEKKAKTPEVSSKSNTVKDILFNSKYYNEIDKSVRESLQEIEVGEQLLSDFIEVSNKIKSNKFLTDSNEKLDICSTTIREKLASVKDKYNDKLNKVNEKFNLVVSLDKQLLVSDVTVSEKSCSVYFNIEQKNLIDFLNVMSNRKMNVVITTDNLSKKKFRIRLSDHPTFLKENIDMYVAYPDCNLEQIFKQDLPKVLTNDVELQRLLKLHGTTALSKEELVELRDLYNRLKDSDKLKKGAKDSIKNRLVKLNLL